MILTTSGGWFDGLFSVVFDLVFMCLSFSKFSVSLGLVCLSFDLLSGVLSGGFVLE
ncbi:hypothetical protein [Helicobacter rappini]|uniref:hypothetical protein n=1 Tax=Helicobacter rappini TaxID=95150 RepID=UPI001F21B397|nr:hypothetical protein [Helicobacter rappini]